MTCFPYDFSQPAKRYTLPNRHKEISGISPLEDNNSIAFVQDEAIQIHLLDLHSGTITELAKHDDGDAEDIAIVGTTAYVLKAGKQPAIYRATEFQGEHAKIQRYGLELKKHHDPEGLCHDARRHRLLIACKGSANKNDTMRAIYAFDLQAMQMTSTPVFTIDSRSFLKNARDAFNPSGLAIHPHSGNLYIIGSKGHKMIVCYGLNGQFKEALKLDKDQFIQPEGLAFLPSGDLLISSEGKKGKQAELLMFQSLRSLETPSAMHQDCCEEANQH